MTEKNPKPKNEYAPFPETAPQGQTPVAVDAAATLEQWNQMVAATEKAAGDLVASPIVREGYLAHGHPADLGFVHLNSMTSSRIRKRFPLATKYEPLFAMLYAQGKLIVGQGLVKKYTARKENKTFDHTKWINKEFDKLFSNLDTYREQLREIAYNASRTDK